MTGVAKISQGDFGQPVTMTSLDIAEITGKRHDHIMRDIRAMLTALKDEERDFNAPKFGAVDFVASYVDAKGESRECFNLPKRETLILVSGYSIPMRARIIDRWQELESGKASPAIDYSDPRHMLGVLSHLQIEMVRKDDVIAEQGQRLQILNRLEGSDGSLCITDAAKTLKVSPSFLFSFAERRRLIFRRRDGKYRAYQWAIDDGLLEHNEFMTPRGNRERVGTQARVTGKGLTWLSEQLELEGDDDPHEALSLPILIKSKQTELFGGQA